MTAVSLSVGHRSWGPAPRLLSVLAVLTLLAGCATPARIAVPAELPLRTYDQIFAIQWALQRETTLTRAVGLVRSSFGTDFFLTLVLFGVDAEGRIVSRGTTYVRSEFGGQPSPFAVEITPVGRETRFELRVLDSQWPGRRSN
jgi:hypothetical protein